MQSKKEHLHKLLQEKFFADKKPAKNNAIVILGLGTQGGGVGAARFFARLGFPVCVTDHKPARELKESLNALKRFKNITYVLGRHRLEDIKKSALVVKNPAIPQLSPFVRAAHDAGIPVTNDAALFLSLAPREKIIGITGTKGKTTTAILLKHIIGARALLVGTPGISFFEYFFQHTEPKWIIAEFSSFDLECIRESPHIAVITSLFSDHLNRYPSFRAYVRAKMNLIRFQNMGDFAVLYQDPRIRHSIQKTRGSILWVHEKNIPKNMRRGSWRIATPSIALAVSASRILGMSENKIGKKILSFTAPHGRLEIIRTFRGRIFINDTTSTNPGAATFSLLKLKKHFGADLPITVITGGDDKAFPLHDLRMYAIFLKKMRFHLILLAGSMTEKLRRYLPDISPPTNSLQDAIERAAASPGVIVLAPGAASFNMFRNEFDRAEKFIKHVRTWQPHA